MRILTFGWELPPHNSGGLGVACYGLARAMSRNGAEIHFVLPKRVPVHADFMRLIFSDAAIASTMESFHQMYSPYHTATTTTGLRQSSDELGAIYPKDNILDIVERYAAFAPVIARRHPSDLIHAHDWLTFPAGVAARQATGRPLVVHVHATEFDRTGGNGVNTKVYEIERNGMHAADGIIAVSGYTKRMITTHYGIHPDKITVIHNGIDHEDHPSPQLSDMVGRLKEYGEKIVLFVGRLTLQKGPEYFVRTAKIVLEHEPKTTFIIAGSGELERQLIEEAATLGIGDRVLFSGFTRGDELARLYRLADIYVMNSVSEPFGITALESAIHGTPVLISKQCGVGEVLQHALRADFWDISELANKIVGTLRHAPLRETIRMHASAEAAQCTWERAGLSCLAYFQNFL